MSVAQTIHDVRDVTVGDAGGLGRTKCDNNNLHINWRVVVALSEWV